MDMTRGSEFPLFGDIAATDDQRTSNTLPASEADQPSAASPFVRWTGHLSIGEYVTGLITAGQTHTFELVDTARRAPSVIKSGAAALQSYRQSAMEATSRMLNKAGSTLRSTPETIVDYACIAAMGVLALMGATDWDTRRDRLERYTTLGEELYSPSTASAPSIDSQPARSPASSYSPLSSAASPARYQLDRYAGDAPSDMPAWLLPLYHQEVATTRARVTQGQADLATHYLTQFMSPGAGRYTAPPPPPAASSALHAAAPRERRPAPAYRRIRVRIGAMTMAFAGPTNSIYDQIGAWRARNPGSVILSDEPVLV